VNTILTRILPRTYTRLLVRDIIHWSPPSVTHGF